MQRIRSKIDKAIADEEKHGRLVNLIRQMVQPRGMQPNEEQVRGLVAFVTEYVRHVPHYIDKGMAAANQVGLARQMASMVGELESYWLMEQDVIPDHLGLVGLMDDAYASLLLLQQTSDYCKQAAGVPLLAEDLSKINQSIRMLIGEPHASAIESRVGVTMAQSLMQNLINQFAGQLNVLGGPVLGPDTSWGGYTLDRYVDVQLGAMGVV